jgi:hypothetical protein
MLTFSIQISNLYYIVFNYNYALIHIYVNGYSRCVPYYVVGNASGATGFSTPAKIRVCDPNANNDTACYRSLYIMRSSDQ